MSDTPNMPPVSPLQAALDAPLAVDAPPPAPPTPAARTEFCALCGTETADWVDPDWAGGRICRKCDNEKYPDGNAAHPALRGEPADGDGRGEQRWGVSSAHYLTGERSLSGQFFTDPAAAAELARAVRAGRVVPVRVTVLGEGADVGIAPPTTLRELTEALAAAESAAAEARGERDAAISERDKASADLAAAQAALAQIRSGAYADNKLAGDIATKALAAQGMLPPTQSEARERRDAARAALAGDGEAGTDAAPTEIHNPTRGP